MCTGWVGDPRRASSGQPKKCTESGVCKKQPRPPCAFFLYFIRVGDHTFERHMIFTLTSVLDMDHPTLIAAQRGGITPGTEPNFVLHKGGGVTPEILCNFLTFFEK